MIVLSSGETGSKLVDFFDFFSVPVDNSRLRIFQNILQNWGVESVEPGSTSCGRLCLSSTSRIAANASNKNLSAASWPFALRLFEVRVLLLGPFLAERFEF